MDDLWAPPPSAGMAYTAGLFISAPYRSFPYAERLRIAYLHVGNEPFCDVLWQPSWGQSEDAAPPETPPEPPAASPSGAGPHKRCALPAAFVGAREGLPRRERIAIDELIKMYRRAPGHTVAITVRQLGAECGVSHMSAARAIERLAKSGFIVVVAKGAYWEANKPSLYRLTMFACDGVAATHGYIACAKEWTRQRP